MFEPPTRRSQETAISAPPPTQAPWQAAIVGCGKAGQTVVEVGEELHPADRAVAVEVLADVGAGREAHVVGRGEDEHADALVGAGGLEVAEQLLQHRRVDRVPGLGPVEADQGDAVRVGVVGGQGLAHRLSSSSVSFRSAISSIRRSVSSAAARDQVRDAVPALAEPPEDEAGDDLGVGRVGAADADPDAPEVAAAEPALEALEAVVAGDAAAELRS